MKKSNLLLHLTSIAGIALLAVVVLACSAKTKVTPDGHNSQNSLDYYGTYRGIIPCADCEGIKNTIYLNSDNTYKSVMEYLGRNITNETSGKISWDKSGNSIILTGNNGQSDGRYQVGENILTQLDSDGNKISGPLSSSFILTKANFDILNKKWTLVELMGKPVEPANTMKKDAFIILNDVDSRYSASAGCNSMSGNFRVEGFNKITFSKGISTMMACPDMTLEDELAKVLERADGFIVKGTELQLIKARMAPLAKFKTTVRK